MNTIKYLFFSSVLAISACTKNDGEQPLERPTATASGFTHDARIRNATVRIYAIDENAVKTDELLGEGVSDDEGFYEITLQAPSQPILLETCNGNYTEEFSGVNVILEQTTCLKAFTFYESGEPINVMLTPLTTIAAGLVEYKVQNENININNAITEATTAISSMIGGIDIINTVPADLTSIDIRGQSLNDSIRYAFYMAGISGFTAQANLDNNLSEHSTYTSIDFSTLAYNDIRADGLLNGVGFDENGNNPNSSLGLGTVSIDANTYRATVAQNMLRFIGNENNETTIEISDLLPAARSVADGTHEIFDNVAPLPVDEEPPVINLVNAEGTAFNGSINYPVTIEDFTIVESVEFFVDGESLGQSTDKVNASIPILTSNYSEGEHIIGVVAIDALGNESSREIQVLFFNDGPSVNLTGPDKTNTTSHLLTGTFATNSTGLESIIIEDVSAEINPDGTWSATIDNLAIGWNVLGVTSRDNLGNETTQSFRIGVDINQPNIRVLEPSSSGLDYFVEYSTETPSGPSVFLDLWKQNATDNPLHVPSERFSLNGIVVTTSNLSNNRYPYYNVNILDTMLIDGVFSETQDVKVFFSYEVDGRAIVNRRELLPDINTINGQIVANHSHILPVSEEVLGEDWYLTTPDVTHKITIEAEDEAGNVAKEDFFFKVRAVPEAPEMTSSEIQIPEFDNTIFSDRANLDNQEFKVFSYSFTNGNHPVQIRVEHEGEQTRATKTIKTGVTENQVRLYETFEWRIRRITIVRGSKNDCSNAQFGTSPWNFVQALNGNRGGESQRFLVPAPIATEQVEIIAADTKEAPGPSEWVDVINLTNTEGDIFPISQLSLSGYGQTCGHDPILNQRTVFEYRNDDGFPRNIFNQRNETVTSDIYRFELQSDQRGNLSSSNGLYNILPNETITIEKLMTTPTVPQLNNESLFDETNFKNFTLQESDQSLSWLFDKGIKLTTTISNDGDNTGFQPVITSILSESRIISLNR